MHSLTDKVFKETFVNRTCHFVNRTCHVVNRTCHVVNRTCHFMNRTCHFVNRTCHFVNRTCHFVNRTCHFVNRTYHTINKEALQNKCTIPWTGIQSAWRPSISSKSISQSVCFLSENFYIKFPVMCKPGRNLENMFSSHLFNYISHETKPLSKKYVQD